MPYVNARRAADEAERDLFREIEPSAAPGSTPPVGMLLRALRDEDARAAVEKYRQD
jgi:hypothetical protein